MCNKLSKVYKSPGKPDHLAVKNFSLAIRNGEIFGLLGPNGAGKTTLISMITGIFSPSSGEAWIGGHSILKSIDKVHLHIGVCP